MKMSELWYERKSIMDAEGHMMPAVIAEATTLRDQFAMAALTGLLNSGGCGDPPEDAAEAYSYADAMLKAREAK